MCQMWHNLATRIFMAVDKGVLGGGAEAPPNIVVTWI